MSKYVIFTDHFAAFNDLDEYIELKAKNFIEAFEEITELFNDAMYLVRVYELVKGSRNEYKRVANVRPGNVLETNCMHDSIYKLKTKNNTWFE